MLEAAVVAVLVFKVLNHPIYDLGEGVALVCYCSLTFIHPYHISIKLLYHLLIYYFLHIQRPEDVPYIRGSSGFPEYFLVNRLDEFERVGSVEGG